MARTAALFLIAVLATALVASCARQETRVKEAVVGAVQMTKATDFKMEDAVKLASPAYKHAAMVASVDLGIPMRDVIAKSKFPLSLFNLVTVPDPKEITVQFSGRFARVFIQPEYSQKVLTADMVRDGRDWYFYLYSPVEEKRYGKFPEFK